MSVRKIILLAAIILSSGCAVRNKRMVSAEIPSVVPGTELSGLVIASNITAKDFDIVRADIEISIDGSQRKLLGTVKYRSPGEYLISLRHNTGIEAARIFIKGDSVMVNDRINRNLYIAENDYLQDRFGIGTTLVPLVFGDFLETMTDVVTLKDCRSGVSEIQGYAGNRDIWYCIDCKSGKASSVTVSDRIGRNSVSLSFGEYRKTGYFIYPGRIKIEDNSGLGKISISVNSVEFRDSQKLEFLPGRNYKKIILK